MGFSKSPTKETENWFGNGGDVVFIVTTRWWSRIPVEWCGSIGGGGIIDGENDIIDGGNDNFIDYGDGGEYEGGVTRGRINRVVSSWRK